MKRPMEDAPAALPEETVREQYERLQLAIQSSQIGLWDWNLSTGEVNYSPEWKRMLGYEADEIADDYGEWERLVHPDDVGPAGERVRTYLQHSWPNFESEFRMRHKDGSYRWIMARAAVIKDESGQAVRMLGSHLDITQRKLLETALAQRAEFERIVGEISSEFVQLAPEEIDAGIQRNLRLLGEFTGADRAYVFQFHEDGETASNTHEWCAVGIEPQIQQLKNVRIQDELPWFMEQLQGLQPVHVSDLSELPDQACSDRAHWERQDIQSLLVVPMIRGNRLAGFLGFDSVRSRRDWKVDDAAILRLAGETFVHALVRREVTEALRQSEQKFRTLVEGQTDLIVRWKPGPEHVFVNARYCDYFGVDADKAAGMNFLSLIHPDDRQMIIDKIAGLTPENPVAEDEHRVIKPDGTYAWQWWVDRGFFDAAGNPVEYLSVGRDITERREAEAARERAEAELRQAQKMEVVGRLAGGVAHDFNNMLGVILGYSEQLAKKIPKGESYYEDVLQIRDAALRSAELTGQLLAFSRKQVVTPVVIDINEAIQRQSRMLQRLVGEHIKWSVDPGADLWSVRIDPVQLNQILANLCVNARDAIGEFGHIIISTCNTTVDIEQSDRLRAVAPGDYVVVSVKDDGSGMDEETLSHVFEPFFTTKEPDKGTGLGLATVYGAVKQNGGFVRVISAPGEGATFEIYLPRHKGKVTLSATFKTPLPGNADATILVVEDEPTLLTLAQRALEADGYHVLAAATPSEACRLAREHREELDLLLTDIVMPEMNGKELRLAIEAIKPGVRTVYMSGYTADIVEDQGITADGTVLLQKPFSIGVLRNTIQNALLE